MWASTEPCSSPAPPQVSAEPPRTGDRSWHGPLMRTPPDRLIGLADISSRCAVSPSVWVSQMGSAHCLITDRAKTTNPIQFQCRPPSSAPRSPPRARGLRHHGGCPCPPHGGHAQSRCRANERDCRRLDGCKQRYGPVEGPLRHRREGPFRAQDAGRGDWIRTSDLLNPIQVRYRTALRPGGSAAECTRYGNMPAL